MIGMLSVSSLVLTVILTLSLVVPFVAVVDAAGTNFPLYLNPLSSSTLHYPTVPSSYVYTVSTVLNVSGWLSPSYGHTLDLQYDGSHVQYIYTGLYGHFYTHFKIPPSVGGGITAAGGCPTSPFHTVSIEIVGYGYERSFCVKPSLHLNTVLGIHGTLRYILAEDVKGSGFAANSNITINAVDNGQKETSYATSNATGAFSYTYFLPDVHHEWINATDSQGNTARVWTN